MSLKSLKTWSGHWQKFFQGRSWLDPVGLNFSQDTEAAFLDYYLVISISRLRPALFLGMLMYAGFYSLDVLLLPEVKSSLFLIRFIFVIPIATLVYLLSNRKFFQRYHQLLSLIYTVAAGEGIVMMTLIRPGYTEAYYAGLILVLIFVYILSGMRFYWASLSGAILVILYIGSIQFSVENSQIQYADNYFLLVSSNILLMLGGYFTELFYRREFFLQYQLTFVREKIKEVNMELESQVLERTLFLEAEVTDRKFAQLKVQNALKQKEILLREVYHRTKNNMNVIISMLNMQSGEQKKRPVEDAFKQISERIYSMSLVHEQLYKSEDLSTIRFDQYIFRLISRIQFSIAHKWSQIEVVHDCEIIEIGLGEAVPLGLAINEIISNTFKHGFPDGGIGEIHLKLELNKEGKIFFSLRSNGLPFDSSINLKDPESLGLHLVKILVEDQLGGELHIFNKDWAGYSLSLERLNE